MLSLVYGYGTSGKSALKCLERLGREVAVFTDEPLKEDIGVTNLCGLPFDEVLKNVGLIVVSPSVKLDS